MKQTAIITGASRGIGRACALELAKYFDCIAINSFQHPNDLNEVQNLIESSGTQCIAFTGDISDYDFVCDMMNQIIEKCPPVDLLVNNAGISYVGLLTDMQITDWNRVIQTNLTSLFNCSQPVIPQMVHRRSCGAIDTQMNACFSESELQDLCEDIPACRLGTPEEIAQMVYFIYKSPFYMTGEIIKIDGGYL